MRMQRTTIPAVFLAVACIANISDAGIWTTFSAPGAYHTYGFGIDDDSIVGCYTDDTGQHGFLYDGATWKTLDYSGGETFIYGIDGTDVAGQYTDVSQHRHGLSYDGSAWTVLDAPGALNTDIWAIDAGKLVGSYEYVLGGAVHGFVYQGTWGTLDAPGANSTCPQGTDGTNIVGSYSTIDDSLTRGFLYDGKAWNLYLDYPRAIATHPRDISGSNIVGTYVDASSRHHSFIFDTRTWTWTTIDAPRPTATANICVWY